MFKRKELTALRLMLEHLRTSYNKLDKSYVMIFQDLMKAQVKIFQLLPDDKKIEFMEECKLSHAEADFHDFSEQHYQRWWNYLFVIDGKITFREKSWLKALDIEYRIYVKNEIVPELFLKKLETEK